MAEIISFGSKLETRFAAGKRLSVGIDPHDQILEAWGLDISASGAERFGRDIVSAAAENALCVKPQIAFFERFGSAGFKALENIFEDARQADLLIIADVKRGDIGSTFAAYAQTWLAPGSSLESDAMTVHAYQGFGSLKGAFEFLKNSGKGMFVLSATSNPEAKTIQQAKLKSGVTVAQEILNSAKGWNQNNMRTEQVGSVGVVLGATLNLADFDIEIKEQGTGLITPVLAPGFGHQGALLEDTTKIFGSLKPGLIVHESRSILAEGYDGLQQRISDRSSVIRQEYDS